MPEDAAIAIGYLEEALKLDPNYAVAHAALAVSRETRFRGAGFDEADRTEGVRHARLALGSAPTMPRRSPMRLSPSRISPTISRRRRAPLPARCR